MDPQLARAAVFLSTPEDVLRAREDHITAYVSEESTASVASGGLPVIPETCGFHYLWVSLSACGPGMEQHWIMRMTMYSLHSDKLGEAGASWGEVNI